MKTYLTLSLSIVLSYSLYAQHWEMRTPIKVGDFVTDAFVIDDTTAYASTLNGKLFKTINAGNHWTEAHKVIGYPISGISWGLHFTDLNTGYIVESNGRIYKTTDAAINWTEVYNDNSKTLYEIYFPSIDTGYACGYPGVVLKTIDGGQNWVEQTTSSSDELRDIWFMDNESGIAVTDQGTIYKTSNGGLNWNLIAVGYAALTDVEFFDNSNGIIVGGSGTILKTTDGGDNWTLMPSGTTTSLGAVNYLSSNEVLVVGNSGTILRSIDGGSNFNSEGPNIVFDDFKGLAVFNGGNAVAVGDGMMYQLNNSTGVWDLKYDEIIESNLNRVVFADSNYGYSVGNGEAINGGASGIIQTKNGGKTWSTRLNQVGSGTGLYDVNFPSPDAGYAAGSNLIKNTQDSGTTQWSTYTNVPPGANTSIHFTSDLIGHLSNSNGIYKSVDGGLNWVLKRNGPNMERFYFLDSDTGYVCGPNATIFKTIDAGETWNNLTTPAVTGTFKAICFANDSTGYVVDGGGGYKTVDYGVTWTSFSGVSSAWDVYFPDPLLPDSGYILTRAGAVLKTVDGGANWTTFILAPFDKDFNSFWFQGDYIYASGTWGDLFVSNINTRPPVVDFSANITVITPGSTVNFIDLTTEDPNLWEWSFPGANQSSSIMKNPSGIQYDNLGCYNVTLRAMNAFGSDTLTKNCYIHVLQNVYCVPALSIGTVGGDFIDGVVLGAINNVNTGDVNGPSYSNFTHLSTSLEQNSNYDIDITAGSWGGDTYAAWIDYNVNGIFEPSEKLGEFVTSTAYETQTINFTVPAGATVGPTRLRVYGAYSANNVDPCADYTWGEVEDYGITITSLITGVRETIHSNVFIYPNPTKDVINIELKSITGPVNYNLTSLEGKIIDSKDNVKTDMITIDLNNESKGIYLLKIEKANSVDVYKIIRQ